MVIQLFRMLSSVVEDLCFCILPYIFVSLLYFEPYLHFM